MLQRKSKNSLYIKKKIKNISKRKTPLKAYLEFTQVTQRYRNLNVYLQNKFFSLTFLENIKQKMIFLQHTKK